MGKSLIIPGADFSANAIERSIEEWYTTDGATYFDGETSYGQLVYPNLFGAFSGWEQKLSNKTINCIKIYGNVNESALRLYKSAKSTYEIEEDFTYSEYRDIYVNQQTTTIYYFNSLKINSGENIFISKIDNTVSSGGLLYLNRTNQAYRVDYSTMKIDAQSTYLFFIDLGYKL